MPFSPERPNWSTVEAIAATGVVSLADASTAVLPTTAGALCVTAADDFVRLRLGEEAVDYGLVVGDVNGAPVRIESSDDVSSIHAASMAVRWRRHPLSVEVEYDGRVVLQSATDGHFVRKHRAPPFARVDEGWIINLDLRSGDAVYGLGEKWGPLNRRGQLVHSVNHDALGVNAEVSYKNAPVAWSSAGWGVIVHTPGPVHHAVGYPQWSHRSYGLLIEGPSLDLFVFRASTLRAFLGHLRAFFGAADVPPPFSVGAILSKAYYKDADELLGTAREVRRRKMPCDTITLDGRAWQDTRTRFTFEWCKRRYPDPKPVIDELRRLDFHICVWEYPLISVENPLFDDWAERGWLLTDRATGEAYRYEWDLEPFGPVLTPLPKSGLVDFTHPDAYAAWKEMHRPLFELGIDMIKADFGEQVTADMAAHNGATGAMLRNVYAFLYNRCVYEAAQAYSKSGAFLFSRSGWLGSHRFPSLWGGDPQADWEGLAASIRGGLSWGLSGGPYYATDVGGFYGDTRDSVLYVRWLQASVYSAHLRLHGIGPREPWSYGAAAEAAAMKALQMRYRLVPYLRRTMREAQTTGLPVQRAMCLANPEDPAAWGFDTQFYCGADLLVAPCVRPDGRVDVYLPAGDWVRFPQGTGYRGGRVLRFQLGLDEDCVFARAGTRIPMGPAAEHTGQLSADGDDAIVSHWSAVG